ncbi:MAG: hypothetical protein KGL42_16925, partial [Betaproteobacteria bacterium]|nr:hypothetical protein [Betaproteobacteria bacterium]
MITQRDTEFEAISEKDIFEEARERLQIVQEAEAANRSAGKDDLAFSEGDQWDHSPVTSASQETPELTINLMDALVTRVENNIKQQRPRGKCHPVSDGATIEIADTINGLGRHVEARSEAWVAYDTSIKHSLRIGWGYWRLLSEYVSADSFQQDLRIAPIRNPFTVYMDPSAIMPSGSDMDYCLISSKMKRTEFKRKYPKADNASWRDGAIGDIDTLDWEDRENIRLAEYFRIRDKAAKLYLIQGPGGMEYTRYADGLPANLAAALKASKADVEVSADGHTIVDERESSRRQVEWFQLNGVKVIDRRVLPGEYIPVFRCEGNVMDIDGKIVRRGMVRHMKDPQRMVNYGEVAKIKRLGLAPKAPWVAAEGQLDNHPEWAEANTSSVSVLTYKPVTVSTAQGDVILPAPQRQPPAGIEQGFAEFVQGMRTNLLAVAGMPNEPGADMQGQVVSGRAIQKRQGLSDQAHFQYYDNLTLGIAHTWRVMLEWFP